MPAVCGCWLFGVAGFLRLLSVCVRLLWASQVQSQAVMARQVAKKRLGPVRGRSGASEKWCYISLGSCLLFAVTGCLRLLALRTCWLFAIAGCSQLLADCGCLFSEPQLWPRFERREKVIKHHLGSARCLQVLAELAQAAPQIGMPGKVPRHGWGAQAAAQAVGTVDRSC